MKTETAGTKLQARNHGVDTLRVVSMLMIVALHVFGHGGVLAALEAGSAGWYSAWVVYICLMISVNCFALTTGYVSVDSRFRASRVISLWLQMLAWSVAISALFRIFGDTAFQPRATFFPVMSGRWWYMTAYFGIVFFLPFIGPLFDRISRRQASMLVFALVCMFSLLPSVFYTDSFKLHGGYAMSWLGILALIGGYIKRFEPFKKLRRSWILVYIICIACVCAWKFIATGAGLAEPDRFIGFTSVFILLGSVAFFMFFSRIGIAGGVRKVTAAVSPVALGVYLIHVHPCIWNHVLAGRFAFLGEAAAPIMLLGAVGLAVGIFALCAAADRVRLLLFRLLRIDRLAEVLGEKLTVLAEKLFK